MSNTPSRKLLPQSNANANANAPVHGAESIGEFEGCGWRVFAMKDRGKLVHIVAVTCAPNVRKKARIPAKFTTKDQRIRFARGAAAQLVMQWRDGQAAEAPRAATAATTTTTTTTTTTVPTTATATESAITFDEFARLWTSGKLGDMYPGRVRGKATRDDDAQRIAFMKPLIGDVPLVEFTVLHAEKVLAAIPKGRSPSTLRHYAQVLSRVLKLAVYPGKIIERNPLPAGFLPPVAATKARSYLYPEEEAALVACGAVPLERRILFGFLAREGARYGEAAGLRWSDVDLVRGLVNLDKNKTDDPRCWKLGDDVVRALQAYRKRRSEPAPSDHIFVDANGSAVVDKKLVRQ